MIGFYTFTKIALECVWDLGKFIVAQGLKKLSKDQ